MKITTSPRKPPIVARSAGQRNYVEAIDKHDIVFGIGPAGTGKTYLAVAMAVSALKKDQVSRIILTRPAVEAGEALGFLPGELEQKIAPYLRPLYDALRDMLEPEEIERSIARQTIEVAPLASRKTRRRRTRNQLLRSLEAAGYVKVIVLAAFIAGLAFLIFSGQEPEPTKNFVIALLFFATAIVQLWINQPRTFSQNSRVFLVFGTIFVQLAATKLILVLSSEHALKFLTPEMGWLLAPYAFAPLVLSVLLDRNPRL